MTALFGRNVAFLVNAVSFFASAVIIARTSFDADPPEVKRPAGWASLTGFGDLVEGIRYVQSDRHVAALMLVKAGWGMAGGVLLLMTVMGERVFPVGGSAAAGIGVLYAARGVGAGIGPILARAWLGQQPDEMRRAIAPSYLLVSVFYLMLSWSPTICVGERGRHRGARRRVGAVGVQHRAAADVACPTGSAAACSRPNSRC